MNSVFWGEGKYVYNFWTGKNMMYTKKLSSLSSLLLIICLATCLMALIGCGGSQSETKAERARRWGQVTHSGLGQIVDDLDAVLLMDRRSKLTDNLIRDY